MKHKYKIRLDEPVPSDEQIDQYKNFDRLLADHRNITEPLYRRPPLYRNPRAFIGLMLIMVIAFLVFRAVEEEEPSSNVIVEIDTDIARQKAFLNPVMPTFDPIASAFAVEPGEEEVFELPSGTLMRVPATAYASQTSPVELQVIEITDPLQAALAGIPLVGEASGNLLPSQIIQVKALSQGEVIEPDPGAYLSFEKSGPRDPSSDQEILFLLDIDDQEWKPAQDEISHEERRHPSPHPPVNLNDGFNMVEFNDSGAIRNRPQESDDDTPDTAINWVRSFETSSNGYYLCGKRETAFSTNLNLRFQDEAGNSMPLKTLYQISADGKSVRVYFPADSEFTFPVFASPEQHHFFGFDSEGHLVWVDTQSSSSDARSLRPQRSQDKISNLEELKIALALPVQ